MFEQLTLDDVNRAIREYFQTSNLRIAIITNNAGALKQALVSDTPKPDDL